MKRKGRSEAKAEEGAQGGQGEQIFEGGGAHVEGGRFQVEGGRFHWLGNCV